jgi:hypothetical protein
LRKITSLRSIRLNKKLEWALVEFAAKSSREQISGISAMTVKWIILASSAKIASIMGITRDIATFCNSSVQDVVIVAIRRHGKCKASALTTRALKNTLILK